MKILNIFSIIEIFIFIPFLLVSILLKRGGTSFQNWFDILCYIYFVIIIFFRSFMFFIGIVMVIGGKKNNNKLTKNFGKAIIIISIVLGVSAIPFFLVNIYNTLFIYIVVLFVCHLSLTIMRLKFMI